MISLEGTSIFRRVLAPESGSLPPELAIFFRDLDFPEQDHRRFTELSDKAQTGALKDNERRELEGYLEVDDFLSLMRLKAESSLAAQSPKDR